ncbi:MAG TPA: outer membrane beta-barrel protein [Polyangiaceae bacterium]|nr:outer membrane beta-barrel protein [Polyangiaceae bacterium]
MIATAFKRTVVETSRPVLDGRLRTRRERVSPGVPRGFGAKVAAAAAVLSLAGAPGVARGEETRSRQRDHYLQYGAGFATETVASAGGICPKDARAPCILGSGLGLAIRAGYRTRERWYVGGAYEFSRQDSSNLLRLAILQQLRGEARYYLRDDARLTPYVGLGAGGALYGNEWGSETGGLTAYLGIGLEFEVSRTSVVGAAVGYRPVAFRSFRDRAGQNRADDWFGFGAAHLVALELVFEVRDPLARW